MGIRLFALHDQKPGAPREVAEDEARRLNQDGYGILATANDFVGPRLVENLTRINYWFCEIDGGSKSYHLKRLENAPLIPTRVIESANGYHSYWAARDANLDKWRTVVRGGLVPFFGADPKATDVLRLLRVSGYLHCKRDERFEVREVWHCPWYEYTEAEMLEAFPSQEPTRSVPVRSTAQEGPWHCDARIGIPALNGHPAMGGEHFKLVPTSGGKHNIVRTQPSYKSTGCFVDEQGLIGGNQLGTTLGMWLRWYGTSDEELLKAIEQVKNGQV